MIASFEKNTIIILSFYFKLKEIPELYFIKYIELWRESKKYKSDIS